MCSMPAHDRREVQYVYETTPETTPSRPQHRAKPRRWEIIDVGAEHRVGCENPNISLQAMRALDSRKARWQQKGPLAEEKPFGRRKNEKVLFRAWSRN